MTARVVLSVVFAALMTEGSAMAQTPAAGSVAGRYLDPVNGLSLEQAEKQLTKESGLLGLSGVGNDLRDIKTAADHGNERAQLALAHFPFLVRAAPVNQRVIKIKQNCFQHDLP